MNVLDWIRLNYNKLTLANDIDVTPRLNDGRLNEPRQAEAHEDVEHVGAHGVGHGHVPVPYVAGIV